MQKEKEKVSKLISKNYLIHRWHVMSVENSKEMTKRILVLISDHWKVAGYKVNIQKPIIYRYSANLQKKRANVI